MHCFVPADAKFALEFLTLFHRPCASLAFLADFTLSDSTAPIRFIVKLLSLTNYTLLFVLIERQDHSVHMSSVLQCIQQLYTVGIPLLETYLLPMPGNGQ